MNETLELAKKYLNLGLHPIPVKYKTKVPLVKWLEYQKTPPTEADLKKWFGVKKQINIAIVLGRNIFAVDLDGPESGKLLADAGIDIPDFAPKQRTAHGIHILLESPEPVGDSVGILKSKDGKSQVDIRGVGYIVAAPSIHESGAAYSWLTPLPQDRDDIPRAPEALLGLIRAKTAPVSPAVGDKQPEWVSKALRGVGEGGRDNMATRLAGYFAKKQHPEDIIRSILYSWADKCTPPYTHADVDKTVASVLRKDNVSQAALANPEDFQILGYNHGSFYYLPKGSKQVIALRAEQHIQSHLIGLASLQYWEQSYANRKGVDWPLAANALIRLSERVGIYDASRIRGRGAWWDTDHAVLHLGDTLITNNESTPIMQAKIGRYIYEAAAPISINTEEPLDIEAANQIVAISDLINWERPISSRLFTGWAVLAPICGALSWRPHIWVTGAAGSGKSWTIENILRPLLGDLGLAVQSETTEAGLRQSLGSDAMPITFDEIEGDDQRAQQRIQNVLALARQASSGEGAIIIKGTSSGSAKSYRIRSCFAFSSIGIGIQHHADSTRVTVLSIEKRDDPDKFKKLKNMVAGTITNKFAQQFIARSIRLIPSIRANAEIFAAAGAAKLGSQRLGDQVGALLAGAYSLYDEGIVTKKDAETFINEQDWQEQQNIQEETDEQMCFNHLMQHKIKLSPDAEINIGDLLLGIIGKKEINVQKAEDTLRRYGFRVDYENGTEHCITISNTHSGIKEILKHTKWTHGWNRILKRIKGARGTDYPVRFGATFSRGTQIPISHITEL